VKETDEKSALRLRYSKGRLWRLLKRLRFVSTNASRGCTLGRHIGNRSRPSIAFGRLEEENRNLLC
jgi:hypothetical protein